MSIFVAGLAFDSEEQMVLAKLSILIASSIAIVLGIIALHFATKDSVIYVAPSNIGESSEFASEVSANGESVKSNSESNGAIQSGESLESTESKNPPNIAPK